jgi:hypothetical protein
MAAATSSTGTSANHLGQYFHTTATAPSNPPQQQSTPGFFSRVWRGTQHFVYSPARHATEEAAQGLANRLSELFDNNQEEITNRVRDVFTHALLRHCPENYHQLKQRIRAFLNNPSRPHLDEIKRLLSGLNAVEIRTLSPGILDSGVNALTTLRHLLDIEVTEQLKETSAGVSAVLSVSATARQRLEDAEGILGAIIENHEGALIQTLNFLTQSMTDLNGPIHTLRQQLNHPQHGIIAEGLASLRRDLNARAHPLLRQSRDALETYCSALKRNASSAELLPLIQNLREKLRLLLAQSHLVPQMIDNQWLQLEQFDQELHDILSNPATHSLHVQLLAQTDVPLQIITAAFHAQRGIIEEAADVLVEGNGPIHTLRQQLNHPQHGIIAEGLASLRRDLNARAHPFLRQSRDALETYCSALKRNASSAELLPLIQNLREKLRLLLAQSHLVPQMIDNQWLQLEQFDQKLHDILNNPATHSLHAQLLAQTDVPLQIITAGFHAQRGIIEEAADVLVEGIGRGVMQLETLPSRMYQSFFSPQNPVLSQPMPPSETTTQVTSQPMTTSTAGNPTTTEPVINFLNWNNIATQGRRILDSILSSAGAALSQQGASSLATLVQYAFEKIREHIQRTNEQQHLLETINPMIQRLQGAIDRSSWRELTSVLQDAFQFMQEQQVYLQGLRLPLNPVRTHVSAIPDFIQNINAHQNILQPPSQRIPQRISDKDILQKSQLFKSRSSSIGPAKLVLEKICGMNASDALYAEIYKASDNPDQDLSSIFRERLFEKIDQTDVGFFSMMIKWSAKRVYDFLIPLSSFYMNVIFDNILNLFKNGIKNTPPSQESKEEFFIKLARNWLAVTSGAYNQVAVAPNSQAKDFNLMIEEAIKSPERNGGLKPNELFGAVAKTVIDSFGPRIQWNKTIDSHFQTQIPTHSPLHFLNPLISGLNDFCSFCSKALLFVPQWIGNQILQGGAKIALSNTSLLQTYSEQTIESLRRNTPASYATQRLLYRQLQKILLLLQQSLNDDMGGTESLRSRNTNIKRVEITSLIEYLIEVLNKSQYRTQDRLNNYLQHRASLRDRAGRELDDTFIPEVMETVVMTLSIVLKAITQEDEMQQMLYDLLCIANDSFDDKEPVSDVDFAAIEKGIRELSDQILETAIFHAIDEKFDFTNEKQKRGISNFIRTMKEQSQTFANHIHQNIREISHDAISTPVLVSKISSMIEHSYQYHRERVDALGKADGHRNFHTETKHHLNQLSRQLLSHCNAVAERLNSMKNIADEIAFYDKLLHPLLLSFQIHRTLSEVLQNQNLSSQDSTFYQTQLILLQQHLATLQSYQCPLPLTDEIQRSHRDSTSSLQKIEKLQKVQGILRSVYPLFSELKQEKLNAGGQPSNYLKHIEMQLCRRLNTLPPSEQKNQLNQQVLALMLAQNNETIEAAASQFYALHFQFNARNFTEENAELLALRQNNESLQSRLSTAIEEFSHQISSNTSAIRHHCHRLANDTHELDAWAQAQHDLPIWNLFVFDMQWITETVKNLAFDRAQTKIKQLFESLYQRHNYIGFVNQVIFLPFLEKFGEHHLKKSTTTT